jgi:hypothetical protein
MLMVYEINIEKNSYGIYIHILMVMLFLARSQTVAPFSSRPVWNRLLNKMEN